MCFNKHFLVILFMLQFDTHCLQDACYRGEDKENLMRIGGRRVEF
jgi:hypothetical protein